MNKRHALTKKPGEPTPTEAIRLREMAFSVAAAVAVPRFPAATLPARIALLRHRHGMRQL